MNLPAKIKHILILTGEPSGDFHASKLIRQIKQIQKDIYFSGIGGPFLKKEGIDLFFDIKHLSVMGFTEVLMQIGQIKKAFDLFKNKVKEQPPDLVILIDYPGFNLKAAKFLKENKNIKVLYYITPKVWAWKKSRLKKIKKFVDHAALILPFEEKIFKKANIPCTYVGNPLMDEYPEHLAKPFTKNNRNENQRPLIIGLLPGSRKNEINKLLKILAQSAVKIQDKHKNVEFMVSKAVSISHENLVDQLAPYKDQINFQIIPGPVKQIFEKVDFLIAASGTVTLEAALCCIPTIIVYKVSAISYRIAKLLVKIKYAGLANLIVNSEVMPEFLQQDATVENISNKAIEMINNLDFHQNRLMAVRHRLGKPGASLRTAKIAVSMI